MRPNGNYHMLRAISADLQIIKTTKPGLAYLMGDKIQRFFYNNAVRLATMNSKLKELALKYASLDDAGEPIIADGNYQFETEENKELHAKEYNEFCSISFKIV